VRDFSKISPALWHSQRFNTLPSDDGRYLYLYFLTCAHQNSAGCYHLPDGYACDDLQWPLERYLTARSQLIANDLIAFDDDCRVVMICRWFKHNPPMNEKHLIGIERVLEKLPSLKIQKVALDALTETWESIAAEKLAKAQRQQKPEQGLGNGFGSAIPERLNTKFIAGQR
jgi:hypothetical protein